MFITESNIPPGLSLTSKINACIPCAVLSSWMWHFARCGKMLIWGNGRKQITNMGLSHRETSPYFYSKGILFSSQIRSVSESQMLDWTSPICAHPIISMQRRDWPIPPPMVSGSSSLRSILWKGRARLSSQPEIVSWRSSELLSTRIPIEDISSERSSTSSQKNKSPLSCQSS